MSVSSEAAGVRTGPIPRPLWPVVVWLYLERAGQQATVLVPDAEALADIADFLSAVMPDQRLVRVPGWDVPPLDHTDPDPRLVAQRAVAAEAVAAGEWDLLIADAGARFLPLARAPVAPAVDLHAEAELDPPAIAARGYRRVREVSAPGEYAVRGEIVDLWSPLEAHPVRIDRFDVVIDEMRRFDPVSQLSSRPVEHYRLGIAALGGEAAAAGVAAAIERRARHLRSAPEQADRVLDALAEGRPFPGRALWMQRMLDAVSLPATWDVIVSPESIADHHEHLRILDADERRQLLAEGVPVPHVEVPEPITDAPVEIDGVEGRGDLGVVGIPPEPRGKPEQQLQRLVAPRLRSGQRVWLTCHPEAVAGLKALAREAGYEATTDAAEATGEGVLRLIPNRIRGTWEVRSLNLALIDGQALLQRRMPRRASKGALRTLDLGDLKVDDLVVHEDYGIGRFGGLDRIEVDGFPVDVVRLTYRDGDSVFVPVTRLGLIEPYRGGAEEEPKLDKLGSTTWSQRRAKAKEEMVRFAADLIKLYAAREQAIRPPLDPPGEIAMAVTATFPYDETPDQLRVLDEIEEDLAGEAPMDRLLVGDVGYGKTEIALRAAARFVENGYQVAILVPTTVLAVQHGRTFHDRLKDLPLKIGVLSRFTPAREKRQILAGMRDGSVDIVIATHRLLQPDVGFDHLGLMIVDEEHRFGVKHKEALKSLRSNVDTLAMSATPIPRTLQMHMGGLRPMSVIATPPANRLGVETRVLAYDDDTVREALLRERSRGGQAFVLNNRIEGLDGVAQHLQELIGDLRIGIAHGKLSARDTEQVLLDFMEHRIDVLVATSIIESGLDFPRANTLIVLDAHNYGLAELYQLRGRVGRSDRRAFAYLTYPGDTNLSTKAEDRLEVLRSFSNLGAGFHVAMRDLEIRGAGEVLGKKQAGHIRSLGLSMMFRMLDEAVAELQGGPTAETIDPEIQGDLPLVITADWIEDPEDRLRAYQQLTRALTPDEAEASIAELTDRFGPPHEEDGPFLEAMRIKPLLRALHARALRFRGGYATVYIEPSTPLDPAVLLPWVADRDDVELRPDRLRLAIPPHGPGRPAAVAAVLEELLGLVAA